MAILSEPHTIQSVLRHSSVLESIASQVAIGDQTVAFGFH